VPEAPFLFHDHACCGSAARELPAALREEIAFAHANGAQFLRLNPPIGFNKLSLRCTSHGREISPE